jgi:hypothetical protein
MKKYAFTSILTILIALGSNAQSVDICNSPQATGIVRIMADPALQQLVFPNEVIATDNNVMNGFRIQVYSGTNRTEAEHIKQELSQNYGNIPVYEIYQSPYFKIRVGDFRNRIEAQELFYKLKQQYTGILLAPDKIEFPQLY